jgi:hypothetical protein
MLGAHGGGIIKWERGRKEFGCCINMRGRKKMIEDDKG